ncbi:MAG TPA: molybdate ABC transporter substrate-binding protein [Dermatophilaceae bacterium]|nr:molybdate ABC transporter substrate-binding protein [Dermatophilaceae bacterium]
MSTGRRAVTAAALAMGLGGCGGAAMPGPAAGSAATGQDRLSGEVTVLAAASLTASFTALGRRFEVAHPATKVTFNFGPSSGLAAQITAGAPADVFASASQTTMDSVVKAGAATNPAVFAKNSMEIAVPPANPAKVDDLSDLAAPGVKVALCQAQVPCGATAAKVFANAGLAVTPVTEEVDVKAVLTKVRLGEVDAGVVYRTDVLAAGDKVTGVPIEAAVNAATTYPIATLAAAPNPAAARAFTELVLSAAGVAELTRAGFGRP